MKVSAYCILPLLYTVLQARSDNELVFCLQSYQGHRINMSLVY